MGWASRERARRMAEKIIYDLECHFSEGEPCFLSAEVTPNTGDRIAVDEQRIKVSKRLNDTDVEEVIIDRTRLNWWKTTKRVIPDESTLYAPPKILTMQ